MQVVEMDIMQGLFIHYQTKKDNAVQIYIKVLHTHCFEQIPDGQMARWVLYNPKSRKQQCLLYTMNFFRMLTRFLNWKNKYTKEKH